MIIDHMGAIMPEFFGLEFRVIGRVAFPIFVYLVAEGFRHTKSPVKFLARLGAFALISEPVFDLALGNSVNFVENTNIFYTLFLGGVAIVAYDRLRKAAIVPVLMLMWLAEFLSTDYGAYGVAFILLMYAIKPLKLRLAAMAVLCMWQHRTLIQFALQGILFYADQPILLLLMIPATLVPVVLVAFYNGKRGVGFKWFFYASYPVHLAILVIVASLT